MDYTDIYNDYPELREFEERRARRTSPAPRRKRRKTGNGAKLLTVMVLIALAASLMALVFSLVSPDKTVVFAADGSAVEISAAQVDKYLAVGYYASFADLAPITMYAGDGSVITARAGDRAALEKKGYSTDMTAAYTNMYDDGGTTLYVPNSMVDNYKANGWHDKLSDIITKLYKSDGSTLSVPKAQAAAYIEQGWTDRLLKAAKKMTGPNGEEKTVFNDDVNSYIDRGWTVVKRVIDPDQPLVALTFDDGPGKFTDELLDCLEANNSAATFFVLGQLVQTYPDTVKRADKIGCEIANHTWDHLNATSAGAAAAAESVQKTSKAVEELLGKGTALYRPCYGAYNGDTLAEVGLPAIMWSIDTLDWKTRDADSTFSKVQSDVYDGAIILMHDIHQPTVEAAKRIIPYLVDEGYQLVTVSELLEYRKGGAEAGKVYFDDKE